MHESYDWKLHPKRLLCRHSLRWSNLWFRDVVWIIENGHRHSFFNPFFIFIYPLTNPNMVLCCTRGKPQTLHPLRGVNILHDVKHCSKLSLNSSFGLAILTCSFSYFRRQSSSKSDSWSLLPPITIPRLPNVNVTLRLSSVCFVRVSLVVEWNTSSWFRLLRF